MDTFLNLLLDIVIGIVIFGGVGFLLTFILYRTFLKWLPLIMFWGIAIYYIVVGFGGTNAGEYIFIFVICTFNVIGSGLALLQIYYISEKKNTKKH